MKFGGLIPFTLIDFPGRPAAVLFAAGCNLRCPFCHNPELVMGSGDLCIEEALGFLRTRVGKLQGVCVSGGEPTLMPNLAALLMEIKALGFAVKLDTSGTAPQILGSLLEKELVDYAAVDVKTSPAKYSAACGRSIDHELVRESVRLLQSSGVPHELRTTAVPGLVELTDIQAVGEWLGRVRRYVLQQFRPGKTLDPEYRWRNPYDQTWFGQAAALAQSWADEVIVRGV